MDSISLMKNLENLELSLPELPKNNRITTKGINSLSKIKKLENLKHL